MKTIAAAARHVARLLLAVVYPPRSSASPRSFWGPWTVAER